MDKQKKSYWPVALITYFIIFITAMVSWIVFAVNNKMELVGNDYYEQEVKYQDQIDRVKRTSLSNPGAKISYEASRAVIAVAIPGKPIGSIYLYRPSNASLDRAIPLRAGDTGVQEIDTAKLDPGLWNVQVRWAENGQEYYISQRIVVGS